ncbi:hypothetical protein [Tsukamurella soli]
MTVQYLVGLCAARWNPAAIDIVVGDMVNDPAAGKERDVDVTVTVTDPVSGNHAFKAYEVKHEGQPIDVTTVEQLCMKFADMDSITDRAIVSTSGFTNGAERKAEAHGVTLYRLEPWTKDLSEQFPILTMKGTPQECLPSSQFLLRWIGWNITIVTQQQVSYDWSTALFDNQGQGNSRVASVEEYFRDLLLRSSQILFQLEPAQTVLRTFPIPFHEPSNSAEACGPGWPHTHTIDVRADGVYMRSNSSLVLIETITINGNLQWHRGAPTEYYAVSNIATGEALAGTLVTLGEREGTMQVLVLSPDRRTIDIRLIELPEKCRNSIRRLKIDPVGESTE